MFSKEKKADFVKILRDRGVPIKCPMCGKTDFSFVDHYLTNILQDDYKNVKISGKAIPTIAIFCNNCGFISQHALGVLNLLNDNDDKQDKKEGDNK